MQIPYLKNILFHQYKKINYFPMDAKNYVFSSNIWDFHCFSLWSHLFSFQPFQLLKLSELKILLYWTMQCVLISMFHIADIISNITEDCWLLRFSSSQKWLPKNLQYFLFHCLLWYYNLAGILYIFWGSKFYQYKI